MLKRHKKNLMAMTLWLSFLGMMAVTVTPHALWDLALGLKNADCYCESCQATSR